MSDIRAEIKGGSIIVGRLSGTGIAKAWERPIERLVFQKTEDTGIAVEKKDRYKIFLWEYIGGDILLVYARTGTVKCFYTAEKYAYLRLLDRTNLILSVSMTRKRVTVRWLGAVCDKFGLGYSNCRFYINEDNFCTFDMPVSKKVLHGEDASSGGYVHVFGFDTSRLINDGAKTRYRARIVMDVQGKTVDYWVKMAEQEPDTPAVVSSVFYKGRALKFRRSPTGDLFFIQRPMEPVERRFFFRVMESRWIARILYEQGERYKQSGKKKIGLFYEKFAEKAEEGTYEVFLEAVKNKTLGSYFVIDKNTEDHDLIKKQKHVIKKYSLRYYLLLYKASVYISTESPVHVNLVHSNNIYFFKSIKKSSFVFLQHGITYLKYHGKNSPFTKGKEGAPDHMVVGSEKEKKVASHMLGIPEERFLKTGLPIFSKLAYGHLGQESEDIVAILLTWKPYEYDLVDFRQSSYYRNVQAISEILQEKLPAARTIIVAHPKVKGQMEKTPLGEKIWDRPVSGALAVAKLLITDYSSACYNTFYQGGGVVFFQEDLDRYEKANGKLIPRDDEYIGHRVFSLEGLEKVLGEGISEGKIVLHKFRTGEFERRYKTINEFCDGKNIERICAGLKKLGYI